MRSLSPALSGLWSFVSGRNRPAQRNVNTAVVVHSCVQYTCASDKERARVSDVAHHYLVPALARVFFPRSRCLVHRVLGLLRRLGLYHRKHCSGALHHTLTHYPWC